MDLVIAEILNEIKEKCDVDTYIHLNSFITVKLDGYKLLKEEKSLTVYEENKNEQVLKMFLISKKLQGLSDRSIKIYKSEAKKLIYALNKNYQEITANDIKYYLACMQVKGTCSTVTIDNTRRYLSSFFQFLEDEELILKNPLKKIKKIKQKKALKKPFSYEEIERLKLNCKDKLEIALVEFLISTGVRANELVNLKIADINMQENEVKILGKGNKERAVYLNSSAKIRVCDYISSKKKDSDYLFSKSCSPFNNLTGDHIRNVIKKLGIRAGIEDVHPHRFRRTCATIAHKRGMPIEEISKMLGHSNLTTTQIYVSVDDAEVKKSHEKYMN